MTLTNLLNECDDYLMTNNLTARDIATIAHRTYYSDDSLDDFLSIFDADDRPPFLRDALITALDLDIADLLHNSNLADLIPSAESLNDDAYDALCDRMLDDNDFIPILADLILARTLT